MPPRPRRVAPASLPLEPDEPFDVDAEIPWDDEDSLLDDYEAMEALRTRLRADEDG